MRRTTAALVLALLVSLLTAAPASSQTAGTEIGGTLGSGTTVWTPDHSPYVLTADVIVPPDGHLYIAPGTTVTSEADHQLIINGTTRTDGTTFDLPAGIVVDNADPPPLSATHALFATTTFRNATGAALHVERGSVTPLFATFEDNATAITGGPDIALLVLGGVVRDTDTVAVMDGHIDVWDVHLSGFTRGVVAESTSFRGNVVVAPAGPCAADGTGCAVAISGSADDGYHELDGTWFETDDPSEIASMIWDGQDDPGLATFDTGAAASSWFDIEPPVVSVDHPGATVLAVGAELAGTAEDLPHPGGDGVGSVAVWLYDATDAAAWDGYDEEWVPVDGIDTETISFPASITPAGGDTPWSAELPSLVPGHDYVAVAFATEMGPAGQSVPRSRCSSGRWRTPRRPRSPRRPRTPTAR